MALEFPSPIINRIQSRLRYEAGIPSYDPDSPSVHFPSLEGAIAGSESSPPYLRCTQCRGRLLRGIQSMICVYCGTQQRRNGPLPSISFNTTFAYRRLLESLQVDGSVPVIFSNATGDSGGSPSASRDGLVLSDLLDVEIKWPDFSTEAQSVSTVKVPDRSNHSLNLTGADLDNFFSNVAADLPESAVEEHSLTDKQAISTESHVFSDQDNLSSFQNFQSSDVTVNSVDIAGSKSDDSTFWETEFQSASSGNVPLDLNSADIFLGSSAVDLLKPVDSDSATASNLDTDIKFETSNQDSGEYKNKPNQASPIDDDWGQEDIWITTDAKMPNETEQFGINHKVNDSNLKDPNNVSSVGDDWIQDDLWKNASTSVSANSDKAKENEYLFSSWQHLMSSGPDDGTSSTVASGNAVGKDSMDGNVTVNEMEFGGFSQTDLFATSSIQKGLADTNIFQSENFPLGRVEEEDTMKSGGAFTETRLSSGNNPSANAVDTSVDMLMSQMPDLSFMLDDKLSIPS